MEERRDLERGSGPHAELTGEPPLGWYTGRDSANTRRLVGEQGGLEYDSDYYGDDLPFWTTVETSTGEQKPHLVVPYTLEANDMRFCSPQGFNSGEQFFQYLKDSFDVLYEEGAEASKMMYFGLHCRVVGRPGRFRQLQCSLDYKQQR